MRVVLDASVAVASVQRTAPGHLAARRRVRRVLMAQDEIVVPTLFLVEVAASLGRLGVAHDRVDQLLDGLSKAPHELVPLAARRARLASAQALDGRLRGADACYVAIASEHRLPLCTLDVELAERAERLCRVMKP